MAPRGGTAGLTYLKVETGAYAVLLTSAMTLPDVEV